VTGSRPAGTEVFTPARRSRSPGKLVFRNHLIEVIQYAPATDTVYAEPVLIVSAWIMKYYILNLSPHNVLIKYWWTGATRCAPSPGATPARRPGPGPRRQPAAGVLAALDTVRAIVPDRPVHAVGYCLGSTMFAITAAGMARDHDERLASLTLFTTETDFTAAGERGLFIDDSPLAYLRDLMGDQGYLDAGQMAEAFEMLRPCELIRPGGARIPAR
jgi:polyhydroxyalkanoate synthase subunit PhaC